MSTISPLPHMGIGENKGETTRVRFGGIWKVTESRDSGESFPEGNSMAAALNLEVVSITTYDSEPESRRSSFQKFTVFLI